MELYTIGYAGFGMDEFLKALKKRKIQCVLDVRSVPASAYRPEFSRAVLEKRLKSENVKYLHMGRAFGARQENRRYLMPDGTLDFERFSGSEAFLSGMAEVEALMASGSMCALMCAEKDPISCHRSILVGRRFHEKGFQVVHILPDGEETHADMEERLLELYFPERNQLSLLDNVMSEEEMRVEAYRLQNRKIGFRIEG